MPRTFFLLGGINKKSSKTRLLNKKKVVSTDGPSSDWTENEMYSMIHAACVHALDSVSFGHSHCCVATGVTTVPNATFKRRLNEIAEYFGFRSFDELRDQLQNDPLQREKYDVITNPSFLQEIGCCAVRSRGMKCYLKKHEEEWLAIVFYFMAVDGNSFCFDMVQAWLPMFMRDIFGVKLLERNRKQILSVGWLTGFLRRNDFLKLRVGKTLDAVRKAGEANIKPFFESPVLLNMMKDIHPDLLANMDEAMSSNQDQHIKVIAAAMSAVARRAGVETQKPHISVLPVVTASGELLACLIVEGSASGFRLPHVPAGYHHGPDQIFHYASSVSGFIEKSIFEGFIIHVVIPAVNLHRQKKGLVGRPFFILLDGHAAHHSKKAAEAMVKEQIYICFFPPHTSHILQPLDRGVFHVLKRSFAKELFIMQTLAGVPTLAGRVELIKTVWEKSVTPTIIQNSFKHAGIFPLDYKRALMAMNGSGHHGPEHNPPCVLMQDMVNLVDIYGPDAEAIAKIQHHSIENGGYYVTRTETTKFKKDGSPSARVRVEVSATASPEVLTIIGEVKKYIMNDAKRRKTLAIPNRPYSLDCSFDPAFFIKDFESRRARALKKMPWKTLHPILRELVEDSSFPEFRLALNLNDLTFKSLKLAEKKTFVLPLITEGILEKYFFVDGIREMEDEDVEEDDSMAF